MNKGLKQTLEAMATIITLAVGGYFIYKKYLMTKKEKIMVLIKKGYVSGDVNFLLTLDSGYIDSWYQAAIKGQSTFMAGNKTFNTQGGQAAGEVASTAITPANAPVPPATNTGVTI